MKLDFSSFGMGGDGAGGGSGRSAAAARTIDALLYPPKRRRLDHASRVIRVGLSATRPRKSPSPPISPGAQ